MRITDSGVGAGPVALPYGRGRLSTLLTPARVRDELGELDVPFPAASDPDRWKALPEVTQHRLLESAAAARKAAWPELPATAYADFGRTGNRRRFEAASFARRAQLSALALGSCLDTSYVDSALDALWAICEESSWALPAHASGAPVGDTLHPVVDLFAAETGAQLAWATYVLAETLDELSPMILDRVRWEIDRRLITPFEQQDWPWMGVTTDHITNGNPWVCHNLLACILLLERDRPRRARLVSRLIAALDVYVHSMEADGSCTEGQSYWTVGPARLFDALWLLRLASGGSLDGVCLPEVTASIRYPVAMHVHGRQMVQHADGTPQWLVEPAILHRYGRATDNRPARQLAVCLRDLPTPADHQTSPPLWNALAELWEPGYLDAPVAQAPALETSWFDRSEVLVARSDPVSDRGLLLAAKGGHNDEDHNHNDVGSFSIAVNGLMVVVDPGVESYTAQTFGPRRYDLWTMRSDWHQLPMINGHVQRAGREHAATVVTTVGTDPGARIVGMTSELADTWPDQAGIESWRRSVTLNRDTDTVTVCDRWSIPALQTLELPLTLAYEPLIRGDEMIVAGLVIDITGFDATVECRDIDVEDRLHPIWGDHLWRVRLRPFELHAEGSWQITATRRQPNS